MVCNIQDVKRSACEMMQLLLIGKKSKMCCNFLNKILGIDCCFLHQFVKNFCCYFFCIIFCHLTEERFLVAKSPSQLFSLLCYTLTPLDFLLYLFCQLYDRFLQQFYIWSQYIGEVFLEAFKIFVCFNVQSCVFLIPRCGSR